MGQREHFAVPWACDQGCDVLESTTPSTWWCAWLRRGQVVELDVSHSFWFVLCSRWFSLTRVQRVTAGLFASSTMHVAHIFHRIHTACSDACGVWNSRIRGKTQKLGSNTSVYMGKQSHLSTCTRTGVRRPAVEKLASPQQAPWKLHEETWAGLLKNRGLRISQEVEIVPGCAVRVARPSCPDYSSEPPGQSRIIRNMLGWSRLEQTDRSGVWLFRGAFQGGNLFSLLDAAGDWKGRGRTAQRGRSL